MTDDTRDRIRQLYFVQRMPLREIARALAVSRHAVLRALVLPGGNTGRHDPEPMSTALAVVDATAGRRP